MENYLKNRNDLQKNEFSMLEAQNLFPNNLHQAKFSVIKKKFESEVKMIKFWSIQVTKMSFTYAVLKLKFQRRSYLSLILDLPKHMLITSNVDQG